jgi:hypothetical protein
MPGPQRLHADLFLDASIPEDAERMLVDALSELDVTARARVAPTRRGVGELQWIVLVALPLQAFLSGVGDRVAGDAYPRLKGAVRRLLARGQLAAATPRPLVLQDTSTGLQVVLESDLSDDGYQQLLGLDLSRFQVGPLHYDPRRRQWRSELDEARGTS